MPRRSLWIPPEVPFTLAHVAPLGVTHDMLLTAVRSGRITRLAHGAYMASAALAADETSAHLHRAVALQLINPQLIASHHTAALAWGLTLDDRGAAGRPVSFIAPRTSGQRSRHSDSMSVHVRNLPPPHRATHPSGLHLTTPARTALDVASAAPLPAALATLDSAARQALVSQVGESGLRRAYLDVRRLEAATADLRECLAHAGTRLTRQRLEGYVALADPRRESWLESISFGHFVLAGLPLPQMQVRIETPYGVAYPDFLWAEQRIIGEADGAVKYRSPEDLVAEKRRQEGFEQMGYLVVRWMTEDMARRPMSVTDRLGRAITARS